MKRSVCSCQRIAACRSCFLFSRKYLVTSFLNSIQMSTYSDVLSVRLVKQFQQFPKLTFHLFEHFFYKSEIGLWSSQLVYLVITSIVVKPMLCLGAYLWVISLTNTLQLTAKKRNREYKLKDKYPMGAVTPFCTNPLKDQSVQLKTGPKIKSKIVWCRR